MTGETVEDSQDQSSLERSIFSNVHDSLFLFWHVIEASNSSNIISCNKNALNKKFICAHFSYHMTNLLVAVV